MNGEPVNSCMVLAAECNGAEILTVEGLAQNGQLIKLQEMLIDKGGVQCGVLHTWHADLGLCPVAKKF